MNNLNKLFAQRFDDGCSAVVGKDNDVRDGVRPETVFVHCASQIPNLIINNL
jgi:hypothetical protein